MSIKSSQLKLTPAALEHFKQALASTKNAIGVRVGVKKSGCAGFAYAVDFVKSQQEVVSDDSVIEIEDLKLFIDRESLGYMQGTCIDYVKEGFSYLLKFNNPNATEECGCGESFQLKKNF